MSKHDDIKVFMSNRDSKCEDCGREIEQGEFIQLYSNKVYCLTCADLDHLVFLPSGDTALTRRSRKNSKLSAIVLKFVKHRKRNERQGVLVELDALEKAEQECAADAGEREVARAKAAARRLKQDKKYIQNFATHIRKIFPKCPEGREYNIAEHACEKYSGRIGRSAEAKELSPDAVKFAVVAHIRHTETKYDEYLMDGYDRETAREMIRDEIDKVVCQWTAG